MNWDSALYLSIFHLHGHSPLLDQVMVLAAQDGIYLYGASLVLLWFVGRDKNPLTRRREASLTALFAGLTGLLLNVVISHFWFRPRPFVTLHTTPLIAHSADASFPSDHATGSFGLAGGAFLRNRLIGIWFGAFSVLIAVARVYVGVHYPSDVLGGFAVGLVATLAVARANHWVSWLIDRLLLLWEWMTKQTSLQFLFPKN